MEISASEYRREIMEARKKAYYRGFIFGFLLVAVISIILKLLGIS